ncbi:MAG: GntR family transcriptional regulator [Myxococcota bacterium]|jgi:DNA-binding FadR family transcriptional regulator|nr:GntR family transcriptional regulator [Myxococcota bacterium]
METSTRSSRSAAITAELRDEILRGQYRQGERLPSERDLAERFGVHRGAVREALKRLEQLGIATVQPGGARVAPIEEASLDVVEHLLDLEDPPDPRMVDQVLEVLSGLFSLAARLCAERASDTQRSELLDLLERAKADLPRGERVALMHEIGDLCVEASNNLVLRLVRGGVKTNFIDRVDQNRPHLLEPLRPDPAHFEKFADAIHQRDGAAAADAVLELTKEIRRHAMEAIETERARPSLERMSS